MIPLVRILSCCLLLTGSMIQAADCAGDEPPSPLVIATWNLEWFFDENSADNYSRLAKQQSAPNREEWEWKRDSVAAAIAQIEPTILALQEVESGRILWYLTQALRNQHQLDYRIAFVEGDDHFTEQDVAILYRSGLVQFGRWEITDEQRTNPRYSSVAKHVFGQFKWTVGNRVEQLLLVNLHLRAGESGAAVRSRQARMVRQWIADAVANGGNVIVLGDLNTDLAFPETNKNSEIGILCGLETAALHDDLVDLHQYLEAGRRGTHLLAGKQFDRVLISRSMIPWGPGGQNFVFRSIRCRRDLVVRGRGQDNDHRDIFYAIPRRERDLSDHYPLVAEFAWPAE